MLHYLRILVSCLALAALAALPACDKNRTEPSLLDWVDSPVHVEIVFRTTSEPNPIKVFDPEYQPLISKLERYLLVLDTNPRTEIRLSCEPKKVQVAVATSLDRFAYRCDITDTWHIQWIIPLHSTESPIQAELSDLGAKAPKLSSDGLSRIDPNTIPAFQDAMPEYLFHHEKHFSRVLKRLERIGGESAIAATLEQMATLPPHPSYLPGNSDLQDNWLDYRAKLPAPQQAEMDNSLRRLLSQKTPSVGTLFRSLIAFDPADKSLVDTWVERGWEITHQTKPESPRWSSWIFDGILHRLLPFKPEESAKIACAKLAQPYGKVTGAWLTIAHARAECPTLEKWLVEMESMPPCKLDLGCGGPPNNRRTCTMKELQEAPSQFATSAFSVTYREMSSDAAALAVAKVLNRIPPGLALRIERAHYTVDMPEQPECAAVKKTGQPCACLPLRENLGMALCEVPATQKKGSIFLCNFEIDDRKKRIFNVKHQCRKPGSECTTDRDCCAGLLCPATDAGHSLCVEN